MLKFLKENRPQVLLVIYFLLGLVFFNSIFQKFPFSVSPTKDNMPLYQIIEFLLLKANSILLNYSISFLIIGIFIFLILKFDNRFIFLNNRSFLPSLIFLLIFCCFPENIKLKPVFFSIIFLYIAIYRIFAGYKKEEAISNSFDAALAISVGSLIYFPIIYYFVFVLLAILLLGPFSWRVWVTSVFGLVLPYIITFSLYYLFDWGTINIWNKISSTFVSALPKVLNLENIIFYCFYLLLVMLSGWHFMQRYQSLNIANRNYFLLMLILFLITNILYFIIPAVHFDIIIFVSIPSAIAFASYFYYNRFKFLNEILFLFFLLILIFNHLQIWDFLFTDLTDLFNSVF